MCAQKSATPARRARQAWSPLADWQPSTPQTGATQIGGAPCSVCICTPCKQADDGPVGSLQGSWVALRLPEATYLLTQQLHARFQHPCTRLAGSTHRSGPFCGEMYVHCRCTSELERRDWLPWAIITQDVGSPCIAGLRVLRILLFHRLCFAQHRCAPAALAGLPCHKHYQQRGGRPLFKALLDHPLGARPACTAC